MSRETPELSVLAIPAFQDNYLWLLKRGTKAAVVDPGDAAPVLAALERLGLELTAIVLTHHHRDHTGGVAQLCQASARESLPVFGPAQESIPGVTIPLIEGDCAELAELDLRFQVMEVPGHTRGHIAYYANLSPHPILFCGDTLFGCGCGRLFEGTPAQMQHSLARLSALPGDTLAYCAHEYTVSNLRFALAVDPHNRALIERDREDRATREQNRPTVPFRIDRERETNPFLRWDAPAIQAAAEAQVPGSTSSPAATFGAIRAYKDRF
jgi:hydroxyacylglutathione hydrolase